MSLAQTSQYCFFVAITTYISQRISGLLMNNNLDVWIFLHPFQPQRLGSVVTLESIEESVIADGKPVDSEAALDPAELGTVIPPTCSAIAEIRMQRSCIANHGTRSKVAKSRRLHGPSYYFQRMGGHQDSLTMQSSSLAMDPLWFGRSVYMSRSRLQASAALNLIATLEGLCVRFIVEDFDVSNEHANVIVA